MSSHSSVLSFCCMAQIINHNGGRMLLWDEKHAWYIKKVICPRMKNWLIFQLMHMCPLAAMLGVNSSWQTAAENHDPLNSTEQTWVISVAFLSGSWTFCYLYFRAGRGPHDTARGKIQVFYSKTELTGYTELKMQLTAYGQTNKLYKPITW